MKFTRLLILILLPLVGCSSLKTVVPDVVPKSTPDYHQYQLEKLTSFNIVSKLSAKADKERISGNMHWQQTESELSLSIKNMLGITMMSLVQTEDESVLTLRDKTYSDWNASRLLYQLTGIVVPVELLKSWIKGQVTDNVSNIIYNQNGSVSSFTDALSDWTVNYTAYQLSHGLLLPKQMELTSEKTRIKLRIDKWQVTQH